MENKPRYAVEAVDNVLVLVAALSQGAVLRVSDAAGELGVGRSTAHRLLRMLVYRDFAVQRDDRAYVAGPALTATAPLRDRGALRAMARPQLEDINRRLDETVHLIVRDGTTAVFVDSVEGHRALRVGSRTGARMPAERTSGGKVLLAELAPSTLASLYADRDDVDLGRLCRLLTQTRRQGFALNLGESEQGIHAVGVCLRDASGVAVAALSVSAPGLRFGRAQAVEAAADLHEAADRFAAAWSHPLAGVPH